MPFQSVLGLNAPHGRLEDRSNNFTAMRMVFALIVMASHSLIIPLGLPLESTLAQALDFTAQTALDAFFILSGYMLTAGLLRGQDLKSYSAARVLRIFPGMIVVIGGLWLVAGPLLSTLSPVEYFTSAQALAFPLLVIGQVNPQASLPGLFETHPFQSVDGPLWTIRYELYCYLAAGVLAAMGLWRSRNGVLLIAMGAALFSVAHAQFSYTGPLDDTIDAAARFGGAFMVGAVFFAWRNVIGLSLVPALALIGLAIALSGTPMAMITQQIAVTYTVLWLGYLHIPGQIGAYIRGMEDLSYGTYIIHWPVGQITLSLFPAIAPGLLFAVMATITLPLAWLLRVGVEKPATALKPVVTRWMNLVSARQRLQPHA